MILEMFIVFYVDGDDASKNIQAYLEIVALFK